MTIPAVFVPIAEVVPDLVVPSLLKKKRVLLIDSSRSKRDLRAESMRKLGVNVDCAADIEEARSWWRADLYNLVLMNVENELGHRDKFCDDIRGTSPEQQFAFLVGKPEYLANVPGEDATGFAQASASEHTGAKELDGSGLVPLQWGLLEASRRISAARTASHARTRALRDLPIPQRDSEVRVAKRGTASKTLDELIREEMP